MTTPPARATVCGTRSERRRENGSACRRGLAATGRRGKLDRVAATVGWAECNEAHAVKSRRLSSRRTSRVGLVALGPPYGGYGGGSYVGFVRTGVPHAPPRPRSAAHVPGRHPPGVPAGRG